MRTENHTRSNPSFDEIVFEHRNHAYGAFAIRRSYDRNVITGFIFSAGFVLAIVSGMYLMGERHLPSIADINKKLAATHQFKILEIELPNMPDLPKGGQKNVIPPAGSDKIKQADKTPTPTTDPLKEPEKSSAIPKDSVEYNAGGKGGAGPVLPSGGDGKGGERGGGGPLESASKRPVDVAEVMPEFPGGEDALFSFLSKNLRYPMFERENGITGVVFVSFVVNSTGEIDQIEILRSPSSGFNEEVIRVVKKMPVWKAGIQGGQKVPVRFKLPVRFGLKK